MLVRNSQFQGRTPEPVNEFPKFSYSDRHLKNFRTLHLLIDTWLFIHFYPFCSYLMYVLVHVAVKIRP